MSDLPDGWEEHPLGGLVDVLDGRRVPVNAKERAERPGVVPYYGAAGQVGWIDEALFDEPLVLLGEDGVQFFDRDKRKAYGITGPAWVNNHAHVLRARDEVLDRRYLMHYLNWINYSGLANGTTRLKLTQAAMRRIAVRLPARDEQRRIVDLLEDHLSRLDAASAGLLKTRQRLEAMKRAAAWGTLTASGVEGPRVNTLPVADTDDGDLPVLPAGWEWKRLGEVADVFGGVTKDARKQSSVDAVEVPYLRVANVQRGRLDLREVTRIRVPRGKAESLRLLPGDVLLNEGGDRDKLGRGWVWEGQIDDCIHQNHVFRARVRNEAIDPYLLSWAGNYIGGAWCERNGRQSVNLASISLSKIRLMPVPVPPRHLQAAIRARIDDVFGASTRLEAAITSGEARAAGLRRALLDAAFSGRLTGRSSDIEIVEERAGVAS